MRVRIAQTNEEVGFALDGASANGQKRGVKGSTLLSASEIDGYISALRAANSIEQAEKKETPHSGGYCEERDYRNFGQIIPPPPGLKEMTHDATFPETDSYPTLIVGDSHEGTNPMNPWVGTYPADIDSFDFAAAEEQLRALLFPKDTWLPCIDPTSTPLRVEGAPGQTHQRVLELAQPFLNEINEELHASLLNWVRNHLPQGEPEFEEALATGLRNITTHGNSRLRSLASSALAHLKCLDRFHAGDAGVCRITWGGVVALDDCKCQLLSIGPLQFSAVDYGDVIALSEPMQKKLNAIEREEKNQCTLLAIAAGISALDSKHKTVPPEESVGQTCIRTKDERVDCCTPVN